VRATAINASDIEFLTGRPAYVRSFGLTKPKCPILGSDIAGTVDAVGTNVTDYKPGDEVFGDFLWEWGGLAEYACVSTKGLHRKPPDLSFEQASALPQAGLVALQSLRDIDPVQAGQQVLINAAGGGSGSFAIQLAKSYGAEVTAVDAGAKAEFMKSLGADHVIDYQTQDYTRSGKYDRIVDFIARRSHFAVRRALKPGGRYLLVGGSVPRLLQAVTVGRLLSLGSKKSGMFIARPNEDMEVLLEAIRGGSVRVVIDKTYALDQAVRALRHVHEGRSLGKVVVTVPHHS
jgi:NADPH:quinone reductase-like Zn-dependent oxidoreductase